MAWFAISDTDRQHFGWSEAQGFLARGSLVVETRLSTDDRPQTLLSFREHFLWERSLSLQAIPGGGIILITSQQGESSHIALDLDASERSDFLRITYSWDAPARWGRLAIERPERGSVRSILAPRPRPLWLDDIKTMTLSHKLIHLDSDIEFLRFQTR